MRTHRTLAWTFAAVAVLAVTARAGDAVKLLVEPPKDVTTVEAGDPGVDVQIVGQDAAGARVGPAGKTVEVSATNGDLVLVEAPYKYHFTPPASVDQAQSVKLRAWFKQTPDVSGEATLTVLPHRPFERLVVVGATTIELGKSMQVEVRGVKADGTTVAATGQSIAITVDGAGTVAAVTPSTFTFNAPARTETKMIGATAHLRAVLNAYPKVGGDLSIVITAEAPPNAPGGSGAPPAPPVKPGEPPTNPPAKPPVVPPAGGKTDDGGVVWPTGDVKLVVWRSKSRDPKDEWGRNPKRTMPPAGKALIAPMPLQFLRVLILREDVKKIEVEWYTDKKNAVVHTDDMDKDGRLKVEKAAGKTEALLTMETPEEGKTLYVDLLLTTADGKILTEQFLLQRGRDKDNDGERDKRK